ncbi:MAG: SEC-C domain-containing protein [Bacteroidales bacterium]|nr:SEC-C domain-containing protein [Bacteroidales bacterium]
MNKDIIISALGAFHKVDLEDIRHFFGADVPSHVRKNEFVQRLGAFIVERPQEWLGNMLERDLRLLLTLVEAGPEVPVVQEYPDYPTVLETVGLLRVDVSEKDFKEIWIPKEVYDIVAPHIREAISRGETDGTFEMERAAFGYLNLYGVLTVDEFYDKMLEYNDWAGRWSVETFTSRLVESPVFKLCRIDLGGEPHMSAPGIYEPAKILSGRKDFPDLGGLRAFTPEQAIEAGSGAPEFVFGLGSPEGKKLVEMLLNLGYSGDDLILEEHDIWMNSQMVWGDDATEEIFGCVSDREDDIETFEDYNECMEIVAAYANSLPKWLLGGHSSNEANCLKVILQSEDDPIMDIIRKNPYMSLYVPPVPGNEPCPCGSGLSYRLCHGRNVN